MANKMENTCILETSNMGKTEKIIHTIKKTVVGPIVKKEKY